jgi:hypothetical protein
MKRLIIYFIALQFISMQAGQNSVSAQNPYYFSRDIHYNANIKPFCNNSPNSDFAPFVWNNIIFITSSRLTSQNRNNINPITSKPFLNVYAFRRNCDQSDLGLLPDAINKNLNCGPIAVSRDTSLVIITKNYLKANKDHVQDLYLAYYVKERNKWSREKLFPYNDADYSLQHPYFDDNTSTLYFSSNLPGGNGGFDLYKSTWDGRNWSNPENLGPGINSTYNEAFPSLTTNGDLIYTSDHAGNYGGLDIVLYRNKTRFLLPEPINTKYDDFSVSFINNTSGYFASNRGSGDTSDNIYFFELNSTDSTSFMVRVIDADTKIPVPKVSVHVKAETPKIDNLIITSSDGEGVVYRGPTDSLFATFNLEKEGYLTSKTESGNFHNEANYKILTLDIKQIPPPEDTLLVIGVRPEYDYYVIVNSFLDESRAQKNSENLSKELNKRVFVLPRTDMGFNRVSIGKFATQEEALEVYKNARLKINPDSWIWAKEK